MNQKQVAFSKTANTSYLHQQSFQIFQNKLHIIQNRRNQFVPNDFKATIPSSYKPSRDKPTITKDYFTITNNNFLGNRLNEIICRKNKYGFNDSQNYMEKRHHVNKLVRSLKQKSLEEQNDIFRSRLLKREGFISIKQFEDDFNRTKLFPSNSRRFNTVNSVKLRKTKKNKMDETQFPTITTKYETIINTNAET